ncbi:HNH endonuclease signature motif containing protein [Nocardioides sp. Root140]|uniref:HNH endonuclease signature motif containing protein n=1 Tax=Nocardioides sp. Root140 TaxID=1736460 RepID=UPI000700CCE7|nr:HNH endonuclease signature motif containing protein [Nocardioides sp. Root140]KQY55463.1 hypothetical protein ASD30_16275 [Nocardioides sp. Root140]
MTTTFDTPFPATAGHGSGALSQALPGDGGAGAVLADAVRARGLADDAERVLLLRAVQWADTHPTEVVADAAFGEEAAECLPLVHWAAVAEFAAALGLSTSAGERLIHEALELRHRCERTWSRLLAGEVTAWRARRVAATTIGQPDDVAVFVDEHVHPIVHKVGFIKLEKLLDEALLKLYPLEREKQRAAALDQRQVRLLEGVSAGGVASILISADLKDAYDFNDTVTALAQALADGGCEEPLDVRRALAVGILADPARALALLEGEEAPKPRRKQMTIVMHLSADAVHGIAPVGRFERGDQPVAAAMVAEWAARADTRVTVRPVIDLADHEMVGSYEVPERLKAQVAGVNGCCVFPFCTRPARACDCDHVVAHGAGGRTCSCNLAPLCRRHHRLKTHTGWGYHAVEVGTWLWTSPHGHRYLRDATGTSEVTRPGDVRGDFDGCLHTRPPDDVGQPDDPDPLAGPGDPPRRRWRDQIMNQIDQRIAVTSQNSGWPWLDPDYDPTDLDPRDWAGVPDPHAPACSTEPEF